MKKNFTILKMFLSEIMMAIIIGIAFIYFRNADPIAMGLIMISVILLSQGGRLYHYKITIQDEKLIMFRLFSSNVEIRFENITKIEVIRVKRTARIAIKEYINVFADGKRVRYNTDGMEKEKLYECIEEYSKKYNFLVNYVEKDYLNKDSYT